MILQDGFQKSVKIKRAGAALGGTHSLAVYFAVAAHRTIAIIKWNLPLSFKRVFIIFENMSLVVNYLDWIIPITGVFFKIAFGIVIF